MGVDHIGAGQLRQELDRSARAQRRVAKATLQNASIGRAGIRVYDGGWIRIEDGGLSVTGTQTVSGTLQGSGTFNWTGPMNLQGAQTITGPTTFTGQMTVNGPWKFVGNGEITGDVTLTGDLTAGNVVIRPTTNGGQIGFGSGRRIDAGSGFLGIYDGSRFVVFNSTGVSIYGGGAQISVRSDGITMSGLPTMESAFANGAVEGTIWQDSSGRLYRIIP